MLIGMEYGCCRDFKRSICHFRDNCNRYNKAPDDRDIGLWEAFKRICLQMCSWALRLYQTLPNYTRSRGIICYSFVCLVDRIGQLMRTNRKDCTPLSLDMHSCSLRNAVPAMQILEGEDKDFNGVLYHLMSVFDGVQCQQMVKGVMPHTDVESDRYQ